MHPYMSVLCRMASHCGAIFPAASTMPSAVDDHHDDPLQTASFTCQPAQSFNPLSDQPSFLSSVNGSLPFSLSLVVRNVARQIEALFCRMNRGQFATDVSDLKHSNISRSELCPLKPSCRGGAEVYRALMVYGMLTA